MIIVSIRTDKPIAEIGLYKDGETTDYLEWDADRMLAETIHQQIKLLLAKHDLDVKSVNAVIVYEGPGSFTGLRIGISVANALASSLNIPIISGSGENWITKGLKRLDNNENDLPVIPEYGALPHITQPRK